MSNEHIDKFIRELTEPSRFPHVVLGDPDDLGVTVEYAGGEDFSGSLLTLTQDEESPPSVHRKFDIVVFTDIEQVRGLRDFLNGLDLGDKDAA